MDEQNNQAGQAPVAPSQPSQTGGEQKNIGMAVVAYILFFVPLLTEAKKDPFVKFHVKQGLVLLIVAVAVSIINSIMPYYFWMMFSWVLNLAVFVLWLIGVINAAGGKQQPLPVVGQFAEKFKF